VVTSRAILRAAKRAPAPRHGAAPHLPALGGGYAGAYAGFLPRPAAEFTQGAFGPSAPIIPSPVDEPDDSGRAEPRREEYRVGWNLPVGTPGSEGLKLASFSTLKTLADLYSVARACIQLRKSEVRGLEWDIVPTAESAKANRGDKAWFKDFGERRAKVKRFFRRPDPDYYSWNTFLDALLEEVFVFDAPAIYLRPKRGRGMGKGLLGSDLDSLNLISGPTIRPLYDIHGGYPTPPAPAYQQYLYGVPRSDFTKMLTDMDIAESGLSDKRLGAYRGDQLIYMPMVPRRWTPYGFPPIERAMIPVLSGLQKQGWQLDFFREGTVPAVYMSPGDENMTPNQISELQTALNAIAGDPAWHHKIIVLPPGTRVEPQRHTQLADQFDEIVMNQVCMAFDVMPMELGIAPKVSTSMSPGASNQMAKIAQSIGERKATKPTLMFIADIMNAILWYTCGQEDMQFTFEGLEALEDQLQLTELLVNQIKNGLRSVDEARDELNLQPWGLPETSGPVYLAPTGPIPFGAVTPMPGQPTPTPGSVPAGGQPHLPAVAAGSGQSGPAPATTSVHPETPAHVAAQAHVAASGAAVKPAPKPAAQPAATPAAHPPAGKADSATLAKAVDAELEALSRHVRKGRQISTWTPRHISPGALARISQHLAEGLAVDDAIRVVKAARRTVDPSGQVTWTQGAPDDDGRAPVRHFSDAPDGPATFGTQSTPGAGRDDYSGRARVSYPEGGDDTRTPLGRAVDLHDGARRFPAPSGPTPGAVAKTVNPGVVEDLMRRNFRPEGYTWVDQATWTGPVQVDLDRIDFSGQHSWAAHHEPDAVARFADALRAGRPVRPVVLVHTPGDDKLKVVDGHHRVLAAKLLGRPVAAYVGTVPHVAGPWDEAHSYQLRDGDDSHNN
jgi:hypothetical protein